MKLLLIEDEELAVKKLQKTLFSVDPDIEIVGTADSCLLYTSRCV